MKPGTWTTKWIATGAIVLTALASPVRAQQGWVTVNPDGSVTRTEVHVPELQPLPQTPRTVGLADGMRYSWDVEKDKKAEAEKALAGRRQQHTYASPYPINPYPTGQYYGGYYAHPGTVYGGAIYSGPIGPPTSTHASRPWITSIPLGGVYYGPAPVPCPPPVVVCPPAPGYYPGYPTYPTYPSGYYGGYGVPGTHTRTHGSVTMGGGGISVTIGGRRDTYSHETYTYAQPRPIRRR